MFSWLAKRMLTHAYERLNAGDPRLLLALEAKDVHFRFPGESSFSVDVRGKSEVEAWLGRMIATGLQHQPEQVVVQGWPWRMTICLRSTDRLAAPDGEVVYSNRYVIWGRMAWGRLREYEVYEDTQRLKGLDEYLSGAGLAGAQNVAESRAGPAL
jgi:ketosteroid isomerase-like protein